MAVAQSSKVSGRNSSGDLTLANVVVGASDNAILVLTTVQDSNHANYPVVSITRDGQSFTKIGHYEPAGNVRVEGWILKSPNVNTSNVVIDVTGSVGEFSATAFVLSGADITTQPDVYTGGSGNGFSPTLNLTTTVDGCMLYHVLCAETSITGVGSGQTSEYSATDQGYENGRYSSKLATTAGSQSMSASMSSGQPYAQMAVGIRASVSTFVPKVHMM